MELDADIAVVGLGAWGSAALWRLAERGVRAIGIERYQLGHAFGSSHGGSRMFRLTCLEHPGLVPLARRSLRLWRDLETASGQSLLRQTGGLLIGPAEGSIVGGTLRASLTHQIEVDRLSAAELAERFPQHQNVPADHLGVWEPSAGLLRPEACIRAAAGRAAAAGARIFCDTRVNQIEPGPGAVLVRTATRDFRVGQVVLSVGAWTAAMLTGLPLRQLRMPITWYRPDHDPARFELARFPVFMRQGDDGAVLWGNGREGGHEVKLGLEASGRDMPGIDPDTDDRSVRVEDWAELSARLAVSIPGLPSQPAQAAVCMLAETPDGQFVIGRPGGNPRLLVAGGCNAHGFKHASGIGELLAQLAIGEPTFCDVSFLDPNRF